MITIRKIWEILESIAAIIKTSQYIVDNKSIFCENDIDGHKKTTIEKLERELIKFYTV